MDRRNRTAWPLLLPVWVALGVFFLAPLVLMLCVSFAQRGTYGGIEPVRALGAYLRSGAFVANYARSFDAIYLAIGWRAPWMAALPPGRAIPPGFALAQYLPPPAPARG